MEDQMDISLLVNISDGYFLQIHPHSDPTGLGLDPNPMGKHLYKTVEELYVFLENYSLPEVPDLVALKQRLSQRQQNDAGCLIARISKHMAEKMGFSV